MKKKKSFEYANPLRLFCRFTAQLRGVSYATLLNMGVALVVDSACDLGEFQNFVFVGLGLRNLLCSKFVILCKCSKRAMF